jgi:hypothetical protein
VNLTAEPGIGCSYFLKEVSEEDCARELIKTFTRATIKTIFFIAPKINKLSI